MNENNNITKGLSTLVNNNNNCYFNCAIQLFSHNILIKNYLLNNKNKIIEILIKNISKIFQNIENFNINNKNSNISLNLRKKIFDKNSFYTKDELNFLLNNTVTYQLIKLLEYMWSDNLVIIPSNFLNIFYTIRNNFFSDNKQHDAEEAYTAILEKIIYELSETKNIIFENNNKSVLDFIDFKNKISDKINNTNNIDEKKKLLEFYNNKKKEHPKEYLIIESYREIKKYMDNNYSKIYEYSIGFTLSSLICPLCKNINYNFESFSILSVNIPTNKNNITIYDCLDEYFKDETLDENNKWLCQICNIKVNALKKNNLWITPPFLIIQLKRFIYHNSYKDNRMVNFPLDELNIKKYIHNLKIENILNYKLKNIVYHIGNLNSGHYYYSFKHEQTKKWYLIDDHKINIIEENKIINSNVYLLCYFRSDLI